MLARCRNMFLGPDAPAKDRSTCSSEPQPSTKRRNGTPRAISTPNKMMVGRAMPARSMEATASSEPRSAARRCTFRIWDNFTHASPLHQPSAARPRAKRTPARALITKTTMPEASPAAACREGAASCCQGHSLKNTNETVEFALILPMKHSQWLSLLGFLFISGPPTLLPVNVLTAELSFRPENKVVHCPHRFPTLVSPGNGAAVLLQ